MPTKTAAPGIGKELGRGVANHRRRADELRVVGDHQKVERSDQLHSLPCVRDHLFTSGEPVAGVDVEPGADQTLSGFTMSVVTVVS